MADLQPLLVTKEQADTIWSVCRRVLRLRGPGVTNGPDGITISPVPSPQRRPPVEVGFVVPVLVTQNGGSAGTNKSAACTYTYDLYHAINDPNKTVKLNTSPVSLTGYGSGLRGMDVQMTAGTQGLAYRDGSGAWKLIAVDERPAEQDCS